MLKQHDYEYLHIYCKCTCNETRSDERVKCLSNLHLFQRVLSTCIYNVYINTLYMTGIIHPHSVCVVSMLDPAMFGCATLVSAPVKEGPRNVSFVHLQPPAHRESIGILLVYLSVAYYSWTGARGTRMKNNATSGLPLSVCASICALIILIFFTDNSYAKRE